MSENTLKYDFSNFFFKKRSLITLEGWFLRNFRLFLRFKKNCDVMEQFWRQIRIQRAKIHKTSLVRSPAQGTFSFVGLCYFKNRERKRTKGSPPRGAASCASCTSTHVSRHVWGRLACRFPAVFDRAQLEVD